MKKRQVRKTSFEFLVNFLVLTWVLRRFYSLDSINMIYSSKDDLSVCSLMILNVLHGYDHP